MTLAHPECALEDFEGCFGGSGLVLGCPAGDGQLLTFTSSAAVRAFLPQTAVCKYYYFISPLF